MNKLSIVIHNVRLIDPYQDMDQQAHVLIENKHIQSVFPANKNIEEIKADKFIDGTHKFLMPSIIDTNTHLREPGFERKATLSSELRAALNAGIGHIACLPTCVPCIDTPALSTSLIDKAREIGASKLYPIGALTKNLEGSHLSEMKALSQAGCIALTNYYNPLANWEVTTRCYEYAATFGIPVIIYPQIRELAKHGGVHDGFWSAKLGLPPIPSSAETIAIASHLLLIEQTGVKAHFSQLSCAKSVELIEEAKKNGLQVTADVAAHQLFLEHSCLEGYDSLYHLQPPIRTQTDIDALISGLKRGVIDCINSSHQPHEAAAKNLPFQSSESGISALETLLPLAGKLQEKDFSILEIAKLLSKNPATIFGIKQEGFKEGALIDACLVEQKPWTLKEKDLLSAGKNSPFTGTVFSWKNCASFVAGKLLYQA